MISPLFNDFIIIDHNEEFLQDINHTSFPFSCLMEDSANSYPPWMYCDNGTCRCGEIPHSILRHLAREGVCSRLLLPDL